MKRILALTAVVLLVSLYIATLVCAIINSPFSNSLFKASVALTILIPVLIFAIMLVRNVLRRFFSPQSGLQAPPAQGTAPEAADAPDKAADTDSASDTGSVS